jgi:hypothetical protein
MIFVSSLLIHCQLSCDRDRMVVGFITTYAISAYIVFGLTEQGLAPTFYHT